MKISIIGGTGLLGSNLLKLYSSFDVRSFSRNNSINISNKKNFTINFSDLKKELHNVFESWKPDIIINTVAIVNLQKCEDDVEYAKEINCNIAVEIAEIAKEYNSYFIHISTDHYYNDVKQKHSENDKVQILNNYAKTKYLAEQEVLKLYSNSLIVRTNIIGFRNNNIDSFFEWLLKSLKDEYEINLYSNFFTSPIAVNLLGSLLVNCYDKQLNGIYNISSSEVIDKYNFGLKLANKFALSTNKINNIKFVNEDAVLSRALNLGLNVSKIEKDLGEKMPTIDDTLSILYKEYKDNYNE